jgi:HEAT repeats
MSYPGQGYREFHEELDCLSLDELMQRFRAPEPVPDELGTYFSEIGIWIGMRGEEGLRLLLDEAPAVEDDEERLSAVLEGLSYGSHEDAAIVGVLLAHLNDARPAIVLVAIESLGQTGATSAHDAVLALRDHPSPYVRGSVLRYLQHVYPEEAVPAMLQGLRDPEFIVRESAIDGLDELGIVAALPAIRPFVNDPHPHVRQAAEWAVGALEELAREGEPDD